MKVGAFRISEQKLLEPADVTKVLAAEPPTDSLYWVDVEQPVPESLEDLLSPLGLHPLAMETILDPVPSSLIAPFPGSLVVRLPLQDEWDDLAGTVLVVVCLPQRIVTLHTKPLHALEKLTRDFSTDMQFHATSASAILYQILDELIDRDMDFVLEVRRRVDEFEETFQETGSSDLIRDILAFRRRLVRLEAIVEDQHRCANALQTLESKHFSIVGLQEYMRDTISHSQYALRSLGRQEARLNELYQHYQLSLHDKAESRLRTLTILSAIFMPLTLIAGIYGMNFRYMPELEWKYSHPVVLVVMVLLAGGMLLAFYRRGWFQ